MTRSKDHTSRGGRTWAAGLMLLAALAAAAPDPASAQAPPAQTAQGTISPSRPAPPPSGPIRPTIPEVMTPAPVAPIPEYAPEEPQVTGAPAALRLTYRDAVRLTLERSPALEEYRSRIREAQAGVEVARAPGRPQVGLDATYTRTEPGQVVNFGGNAINLSPQNNYNLGLTLRQAIATFGRLHWANLAAELAERTAREEYRAQLEGLIQQASTQYLTALLAGEEVAIFRQQLGAREEFLRTAELLFQAGTVARFDILRARSEVSTARQNLLEAENAARSAKATLASLMGLDPGVELELEAVETAQAPPADALEAKRRALDRRPELRALQWAVEASRARVELEASQDNPTLGLQSTATHRNAAGLAAQTEQWNTSLVFSVPLFDGGTARARADQAREVVSQLEQRLVASQRDVALDVEKAWLDLSSRWERIQVAEENLAQAEEAARVALIRYQAGLSISLELLEAETALTRARQTVAGARYLYLAAGVAWNRATSQEYPVEVPGPLPASAPESPALEDPAVPVILPRSSHEEGLER